MGNINKNSNKGLDSVRNSTKKIVNNVSSKIKDNSTNIEQISQDKMMQTLDWAYSKTMTGMPGQKNIQDLVDDYLSLYDKEVAINKLINAQTTKAATSGFVTGFGGVITMPVTIPANVTTVILFQMRMIAAIASMRGYNLNSDQVQTFVYATLAGTSVSELLKKSGIVISNKLMLGIVEKIPGKTLTKINQAVGFRLVTKFGSKGAVNLGKMVPIAGAVVGGTFDTLSTKTIARLAKKTFTDAGIYLGDDIIIPKEEL
ncbi:hypothetical protein BG262_08425 [Floricoccus penangensis]|uniref:EcsC family protein n=1 Tax=Floricoccus penangensis TaxID=1859475 RepID=A0A9Q5JI02_9LACT|nr:EcsC family protein [Floricoccus penangensis]OFI47716.1 hypothetical protein BG262_08425 [Floricoccus penangensis]